MSKKRAKILPSVVLWLRPPTNIFLMALTVDTILASLLLSAREQCN
jgi:hypothetical protein